jgi:cobalt-precorrin-5B (C1)-methyltransferase
MVRKPERELRRGWTTGACATAATKAALSALLTGRFPDPVSIRLPRGETPAFALALHELGEGWARAGIVKDAGDDPDVTHLALIVSRVAKGQIGQGVVFKAGEGVGTVTKAGLPIAVGDPAINPVPRQMMRDVVEELARTHGIAPDVAIEISVPGGAEIAKQTWNPRLGIVGGISILGTTGIVRPFSCSAWIASIHRGIDVIRAEGGRHAAACTGATTEAAVRARTGLPETSFIDMGDFVGATLKYLRRHPIPRLTLGGGFGKFCKLAQGHLDLHSGRSGLDIGALGRVARDLGASEALASAIGGANTAMEALAMAREAGIDLGGRIAATARDVALREVGRGIDIEVLVYDRAGGLAGEAGFAP